MIALLLAACLQAEAPGGPACLSCHGSENAAPPVALGGSTDPLHVGVGAHQQHLTGEKLGVVVDCSECHVVPAAVDAPGHVDDPWPADIKWGDLTKTGGLTVTWDRDLMTCSGSYCHGGGFEGGAHTAPVWTDTTGTQLSCGSCHGFPPPPPHPASSACEGCHSFAPETHVDGVVQFAGSGGTGETGQTGETGDSGTVSCEGCHGEGEDLAPPPDTLGNTDPSFRGVGAHEAHQAGTIGAPVACGDCHVVPATVAAAGHIDGGPAEVTFAGVATGGFLTPVWDDLGLSCSGTYCHGAIQTGGQQTTPVWTTVDGSQATCDACHGAPPPSPHPAVSTCESCHPTAGPSLTIADPLRHVDGVLDL